MIEGIHYMEIVQKMNIKKCNVHDKEIKAIRTEFNEFKKEVSMKLDDLFDEINL